MEGKTINGYTLQRLLGKGGMAEVWYAENSLGKCAAIKILLEKFCHDEAIVARFQNEAKVMVQLDHPYIRQVYDFGHIDGRPCILMEYLEGDDLKALMKSGRRFKKDELIKWWDQIADALTYTHDKGIVHRDIKPSNIFLDKKGNIKLLDFGIAKIKESISMTQTGAMMGTLLYMSPEQVEDSKHIGPKSDIYSLAVTFVHLLTGKAPYDTTTSNDYNIRKGIVEIPLDLSKVPSEWQSFLKPYLAKKADERPELRHYEPTELPKEEETPVINVADEETAILSEKKPKEKLNKKEKLEKIEKKDEEAKTKKKKSKFWLGLLIGIVAVIVLALVLGEDKDTKAFEACNTVTDFRSYISEFGNNAKHYNDAKGFIDKYVNDSIKQVEREALAKETALYNNCTTIEACNSFLQQYPNGQYTDKVKKKLSDLKKFSVTTKESGNKVIYVNGVPFEMVYVKGGTFKMGSNTDKKEQPVHSVTLSDYYIAEFLVTQELWRAVMGSEITYNGGWTKQYGRGDKNPVYRIEYSDITKRFLPKLNQLTGMKFRLPTEAEWEFAARGGVKSKGYQYSGSNNIDEVAWYNCGKTHPVGTKKPNELGIYDMSGNIEEWCSDYWRDHYQSSSAQTNPKGPSGPDDSMFSERVVRGGSWNSGSNQCRVTARAWNIEECGYNNYGFRIALSK